MKKIIALTCLLSAFVFSAKAETKALIVTAEKPEKSIKIEDGQVGKISFIGLSNIRALLERGVFCELV